MSKMLLGETQIDLATAMEECFSAQNYTVHLEYSGLRILERLRLEIFDVIVLEVALPGLDAMSAILPRARGEAHDRANDRARDQEQNHQPSYGPDDSSRFPEHVGRYETVF